MNTFLDEFMQQMPPAERQAFIDEVNREYDRMQHRKMVQRQRIGQFIRSTEFVAKDDIGYRGAMISQTDFIQEKIAGHHWDDDDFFNWWLKRDGEYAKVKSVGTRVQTGFGGLSVVDRPSGRRERIVYPKKESQAHAGCLV